MYNIENAKHSVHEFKNKIHCPSRNFVKYCPDQIAGKYSNFDNMCVCVCIKNNINILLNIKFDYGYVENAATIIDTFPLLTFICVYIDAYFMRRFNNKLIN